MRIVSLLAAVGVVAFTTGCGPSPNAGGYSPYGYGSSGYSYSGYSSPSNGLGQLFGGLLNQPSSQPGYYGQPSGYYAQQSYYGPPPGYYRSPNYYGSRGW